MDKLIMYIQIVIFFIVSCNSLNTPTSADIQMDKLSYKTVLSGFETDQQIEDYETIVIRSQDEAAEFLKNYAPAFTDDHKLLNVNYGDSLVVGAFTGERPNISYSVTVDSITSEGQTVKVHVTETGSNVGGRAIVWPAQFVLVNKEDINQREIHFNLSRICDVSPCAWER